MSKPLTPQEVHNLAMNHVGNSKNMLTKKMRKSYMLALV